jgi:hypothetical protein
VCDDVRYKWRWPNVSGGGRRARFELQKKLNAARDRSHNTVAASTSYVVSNLAVVCSVDRTSCIFVECFSFSSGPLCVMICSATVSVTPIAVASHAARALRLPASPLGGGGLPSKSGRVT